MHGDERYKLMNLSLIRKVDRNLQPDMQGLEWKVIEEKEDGYIVYETSGDPSQPTPSFFIHKRYFV